MEPAYVSDGRLYRPERWHIFPKEVENMLLIRSEQKHTYEVRVASESKLTQLCKAYQQQLYYHAVVCCYCIWK